MKTENSRPVPERKIRLVGELTDLIRNKRTTLVASIKNIPASQFQEIVKKLRKNVVVKVPKKNLINHAIENSGKEEIKELENKIGDSTALMFSDLDSFELAGELLSNKSPAKAKSGQEAPEDIVIEEGPTSLVPGPAISELGALGIQIQIEKGKINIKQSKTIVQKGEKISAAAADLMSKLEIRPFEIGFIPLAAYDSEDGKVYLEISIDKEGTLEALRSFYGKSLALAVEIGYANSETIPFLIGKAGLYEKVILNLMKNEKNVEEKVSEDIKEETIGEEKKEDIKENKKNQNHASEEKSEEEK